LNGIAAAPKLIIPDPNVPNKEEIFCK